MFKCSNHVFGCQTVNINRSELIKHFLTCKSTSTAAAAATAEHSEVKTFRCQTDDCISAFVAEAALQRHIGTIHEFQPMSCTHRGCDSDVLYSSIRQWNTHERAAHADYPPTQCTFEDCPSDRFYKSLRDLTQHRKLMHRLLTAEDIALNGAPDTAVFPSAHA